MKHEQSEITREVQRMLDLGFTYKKALIRYLEISAPTLNSRLSGKSEWRKGEVALIEQLRAEMKK